MEAKPIDVDRPMLLRVEEVAQLLRLGRTRTFQMIAAGELPVVRIGRAVRVPRVALEQWIADRTTPSPDLHTLA